MTVKIIAHTCGTTRLGRLRQAVATSGNPGAAQAAQSVPFASIDPHPESMGFKSLRQAVEPLFAGPGCRSTGAVKTTAFGNLAVDFCCATQSISPDSPATVVKAGGAQTRNDHHSDKHPEPHLATLHVFDASRGLLAMA
jgi:hypothetical protein